jgi:hypothetical protein
MKNEKRKGDDKEGKSDRFFPPLVRFYPFSTLPTLIHKNMSIS